MTKIAQIKINNLQDSHPEIRAEDWRSPLVCRLLCGNPYKDGSAELKVKIRHPNENVSDDSISLEWNGLSSDFNKCVNTYQSHVISEFAGLGLSCIMLSKYSTYRITEVTRRGDKADYWLGNREILLEVSAEEKGNISTLLKDKSAQLLKNPFSKSGYVCVSVFNEKICVLWFFENGVKK